MLVAAATQLLRDRKQYQRMAHRANPYGDGKASARIRRALLYHFGRSKVRPKDFAPG